MAKRLKEESGYSLLEVMVAMIIMTLAILPMVGMFDMGLHSVTEGSKYDKARMLANLKLEQAKNLPFNSLDGTIQDVNDNFPEPAGTVTAYDPVTGYYESGPKTEPGFPNFTYVVEKQYMAQPSQEPAGLSENWGTCQTNGTCDPGTNLIRVTVTVQWDGDKTYTTYGLVAG
jgi:prepilin-type N-terminal cleavage/methylation domain-containing protein